MMFCSYDCYNQFATAHRHARESQLAREEAAAVAEAQRLRQLQAQMAAQVQSPLTVDTTPSLVGVTPGQGSQPPTPTLTPTKPDKLRLRRASSASLDQKVCAHSTEQP